MDIIINKFENPPEQINNFFNISNTILFDIETTGFSPENTIIYLIGCAYYEDEQWKIIQWFNNDGNQEKEIILEFLKFTAKYNTLVSYNGDGFDIRYIKSKILQYKINQNLDTIISVDLYKEFKNLKDLLHLDNLKQRTIESLLSIDRLDKYSGKDLIKVYREYLIDNNGKKRLLLLQHNYEDIEGLLSCSTLLSYNKFIDGHFYVSNMSVKNNRLIFTLKLTYSLPKRIVASYNELTFSAYKDTATLTANIYNGILKFFFNNPKEYYYLPAEDTAVHKSVANFVDKQYRIQATKENCYLKKEGFFISQLDCSIISGYKTYYNDSNSYIELIDSFLQNEDLLNQYAKKIIKNLTKKAH